MKKGKLLLGLKTGALALCLAASVPFSANAATVVKPDGSGIDESKMTEEEKKGYELTKKYSKTLPKINPNSHIPSKYFSSKKSKGNKEAALESKYDSRTKGVISPVKDQNVTGTCWCFSMLEASQASLISKNGLKSADLSEYQEAYFIYNQNNDKLGISNDIVEAPMDDPGTIDYYSIGATDLGDIFSSTKAVGFINESDAKFTDLIDKAHNEGKAVLSDDYCYNRNEYTVSGIKILDTVKQRDEVKKYIKEYGAAQTSYMHFNECFDYSTYAFYHSPEIATWMGGGHAVAIVGCDDNYSKDNFAYSPENDGAWLIKNSWGDIWGNDGYFWMSYEEPSLGSAVFFDLETPDSYDNIYQYDGTLSEKIISDYTIGANVFEAQNDEILGSVSFFTVQDDTKYEVSIYKNPENADDPTSGELLETQEGTVAHMGYTKLKLNKTYNIDKGDKFSVVVKQTVDGKAADIYLDESEDVGYYNNISVSKAGESLASKDGKTWEDLSASGNKNLRIKAFTKINESVSGSKLSFEKDSYAIKAEDSVATIVKLDDKVATGKSKLEYSIENDEIASVDSRGVVTGKIAGETKLTVKYKDKTATTKIKVAFDSSVKNIAINKKNDYATKEKPLEAYVGSLVTLEYNVYPKVYKNKATYVVEPLDEGIDLEMDVLSQSAGNHVFYREGNYKVTLSIEDQGELKGSTQEFYIKVKVDSIDCGKDITKIAEDPYEANMTRIYRFSDPECEGYKFKISGNIEEGNDYLLAVGMDKPDYTDQEIYDGVMSWEPVEGIDVVEEISGDIGDDYPVTVPYKYIAFILISDQSNTGSFKVTSVEPLIKTDKISIKKDDLTINANVGDSIEKEISVLPKGASINDIFTDSKDFDIAEASINEEGKLVIKPKKVGSTDIILAITDIGYDEETDIESEYEENNGIITANTIKITINVSSAKNIPDKFAFVDEDNKEISSVSIVKNTTKQLEFNDATWEDYTIKFSTDDPTIAYVNAEGELIAVATGSAKITAEVSVPGNDEEDAKEFKTEFKVKVTQPDVNDIASLQTLHEYVRGTDDIYTYTNPDESVECMNLYFDARSYLDSEDYITIQDGKGFYYGFDESGKEITKWSGTETKLSYDFRLEQIPEVITIYDNTVKIHLVSKEGERDYDTFDPSDFSFFFMGKNKDGASENSDPYRKSYGFSVKRLETGVATKELKVEDMDLDFSTYRTFEKRLKITRVPENAIDKLFYEIEDTDIASVNSEGVVTGYLEGDTTCKVYTANPNEEIAATSNINVGSKALEGVKFYTTDMWGYVDEEVVDNPANVEVELGEHKAFIYRRYPWNASQNITFTVSDEEALHVNAQLDTYGDNSFAIFGNKLGEYTVDIFIPDQEEPVKTFNVSVVNPKAPEIPEEFKTFDAANFDVDGNNGIDPTEITEDDITHLEYETNESIYWTYKKEGAESVDITFSKNSSIELNYDWIYIYDLDGNLVGRYTGNKNNEEDTCFAGKTIKVPGEGFILGFISDFLDDKESNGFKILEIEPHIKKTEETTEDKKVDDKKTEEKTTATPTPTPATKDKTPQIGQTVVVGKATYKILSKNTVAYVKTNVKNPTSASVPETVKISAKTYKVTEISANAFKNKKKLKKVTIGKNVQKIGNNTFSGCKSLKNITIKGKSLKKVGANAIKGINNKAVIKVPKTKVKTYKKLFTKKTGYKKNTMKIMK